MNEANDTREGRAGDMLVVQQEKDKQMHQDVAKRYWLPHPWLLAAAGGSQLVLLMKGEWVCKLIQRWEVFDHSPPVDILLVLILGIFAFLFGKLSHSHGDAWLTLSHFDENVPWGPPPK